MRIKSLASALLAILVISSCDDTTNELGTSLINNMDYLNVSADSFSVSSRTVVADSVYSRSSYGYLGSICDPETNGIVTANFMTQFHTLEDYEHTFPKEENVISRIDGKVVADSCELRLFYTSFYGDSLAPMKLVAHEMSKPMLENRIYYSNFDPAKEGYLRSDGINKEKTYTLADLSVSDKAKSSTGYTTNICIPLNDPYVDKDGNHYNNYGTYLMQTYYKNPPVYGDQLKFIKEVIPGFYFESTGGLGAMAYIFTSKLTIYFRYTDAEADTTYNGVVQFGGTDEVLQTTRIDNNRETILKLAEDNSCTYLKTPAGLFTEITIPVDDILKGHDGDSINSAKLIIPRVNDTSESDYALSYPANLLMIPKDSLYSFFENNRIVNNRTSFLANSPASTGNNTYQFRNISNLISAMNINRKSENWNKVLLIPVDITATSSGSIVKISHSMALSSTRLVGGSENRHSQNQLSVIYSKFK